MTLLDTRTSVLMRSTHARIHHLSLDLCLTIPLKVPLVDSVKSPARHTHCFSLIAQRRGVIRIRCGPGRGGPLGESCGRGAAGGIRTGKGEGKRRSDTTRQRGGEGRRGDTRRERSGVFQRSSNGGSPVREGCISDVGIIEKV